jgi:hypothetical protein
MTRPLSHSPDETKQLDKMALFSPTLTLARGGQVRPLPAADVPRHLWDIVLFLCAGGLVLVFTVPVVLFVEDGPNDGKDLGEQSSSSGLATTIGPMPE